MNKALFLAALGLISTTTHAALSVTNGGFGTGNQNGGTVSGGGWFESGTTNWIEGTWSSASTPGPGGDTMLLLMDGGSASLGYVYQSLGTVSAGDIANGQLQINADFAEKADGATNDAVFTIYKGTFTGATGTDIAMGGLTTLGSFTLNAAAQGCTAASGNVGRYNNVFVGNIDLTSLAAGDQLWLRIGESRLTSFTTGDLMVDNVTVSVAAIPEPGAYALLPAAGLLAAAAMRRRRRPQA